ncbi:hypothetical protein [Actinomyces sp. ZJ308]|uniref:hypothetical protein n=1 Tax=Actinomyces sp. ZJ308 TaxID=2708342 RepID=UPI00141E4FAE|nr:hypothetical protein [Actinomyces sp. ZJ308]
MLVWIALVAVEFRAIDVISANIVAAGRPVMGIDPDRDVIFPAALAVIVILAVAFVPVSLIITKAACNSRFWVWLRSQWDSPAGRQARELAPGLVAVGAFCLTLATISDVLGLDMMIEGLKGTTTEEVLEDNPLYVAGFIFSFINPTLIWAIPAVLLGFIATKLDLPLRTLAKRSAITAGIMIVISFSPLGGFLPLISLAAGQTIHLLTTM